MCKQTSAKGQTVCRGRRTLFFCARATPPPPPPLSRPDRDAMADAMLFDCASLLDTLAPWTGPLDLPEAGYEALG